MNDRSVLDQVPRQVDTSGECTIQTLKAVVVIAAGRQAIHTHLRHNVRAALPLVDNDFVAGSGVFAFRAKAVKGFAHE